MGLQWILPIWGQTFMHHGGSLWDQKPQGARLCANVLGSRIIPLTGRGASYKAGWYWAHRGLALSAARA